MHLVIICKAQHGRPSSALSGSIRRGMRSIPPILETALFNIFVQAERLAITGKKTEALDICWELRLRPDLGLARRACVNLLLACLVPTNQALYARECINLCRTLREEAQMSQEQLDEELSGLEDTAKDVLRRQDPAERVASLQLGDEQDTNGLAIEGYLHDEYMERHAAASATDQQSDSSSGSKTVAQGPTADIAFRQPTPAPSEPGLPIISVGDMLPGTGIDTPVPSSPPRAPRDDDDAMEE